MISRKIPLSGQKGKGKYAIVDDEDYDVCSRYNWYYVRGYAKMAHKKGNDPTLMHRLIMSPPDDMVVDHLNHNTLDNRKANLRICRQSDNVKNRKGDKNYCYSNRFKKWVVRYRGKSYGYWDTESEAQKQVRLVKSGAEYICRQKRNKYRPKNITRNRNDSYTVQIQKNGVRHVKYGFKTIEEAIMHRDEYYKKIGVTV